MKKILLSLFLMVSFAFGAKSQILVSKMLGKDAERFGLGYGLFTYLDFPLSYENRSIRIELAELAMYPLKGEKFFTTTADFKGYLSIKVGYKYVFSETATGFYILPSAGYCRVVDIIEGYDPTYADGIAAALEGGYNLGVGQKGHSINLGVKYEYDRGDAKHTIQSLNFRLAYAFNMFGNKSY